jgi:hypothetical protein
MEDEIPAPIETMLADWRKRVEAVQEKYKAIVESPDYRTQLVRLG